MSTIRVNTDKTPVADNAEAATIRSNPRSVMFAATMVAALVLPSLLNTSHGGNAREMHAVTIAATRAIPSIAPCCENTAAVALNVVPAMVTTLATDPVVRVEEDWELNITQPDTNVAAPQVGTVMSPLQSTDGVFVVFLLNHRFNDLALGGTEVQFWSGDYQYGARRDSKPVLSSINERVTWTQKLMVKGSAGNRYLCFRVINGQSNTWGAFGGTEPLHMNLDTSLEDLSGYSSQFSVQNSGVTFASNRVASLVLKTVRGYSETNELVFEETTPVVVFAMEQ
jgi:hypothetical protein